MKTTEMERADNIGCIDISGVTMCSTKHDVSVDQICAIDSMT